VRKCLDDPLVDDVVRRGSALLLARSFARIGVV
jgi:hypothetical protein